MPVDFAEPFLLFDQWLKEAEQTEPNDPNAMALATVGQDGMPSVRMVLLKGYDQRGFIFYTNYESRKGTQLLATGKAALCWHWKSLRRQIRVEGMVTPTSEKEADEYFQSRPKTSQIGAWASQQSRPLPEGLEFEKRIAEYTAKYALSSVPRPPYWSGFIVKPERIEFWRDKPFRLHDRQLYERISEASEDGWNIQKLYP